MDWVRDDGLLLGPDRRLSPFRPVPATPAEADASGRHFSARIDSVAAWQGDECDIVVMSLARSNGSGELGFLDGRRIFNVALTRARRGLVIFADARTSKCGRNAGFPQFLEWCHDAGVVVKLEHAPLGSRDDTPCRPLPIERAVTAADVPRDKAKARIPKDSIIVPAAGPTREDKARQTSFPGSPSEVALPPGRHLQRVPSPALADQRGDGQRPVSSTAGLRH